ncbi:hypothetical protein B0H11DRAFT_1965571 [Mycena galericulata]|nr:hypothetical protein B0H11DRAFT_1965571 [Mycena galericulata]
MPATRATTRARKTAPSAIEAAALQTAAAASKRQAAAAASKEKAGRTTAQTSRATETPALHAAKRSPPGLPFYIVAAFSKGPFQGNPAAVVFMEEDLEAAVLGKIAANFNQPMTSFVGPELEGDDADEPNPKVAAFEIRWFTASMQEVPLCGHGTMAAARAIFERGIVRKSVEVIEFYTLREGIVKARRVGQHGVEIQLPAGMLVDLLPQEQPKVRAAIVEAFGRDVNIKYFGVGSKPFEAYLVVELDEKENLGECKIDIDALLGTGYATNVITTAASGKPEDGLFVSRMFAPAVLPPPFSEDSVCGSAHCLIGPYWSRKKRLKVNEPFRAKQVSPRGGDLDLFWDGLATVGLKGETFVMASGRLNV